MPKPYLAAFRRQALALLDEGRTVRDVAASLGMAKSCLQRWKRQHRIDQGLASGASHDDRSVLKTARLRIRDLKEEVRILRKAAAAVEEVVPPKERFRLLAELEAQGVQGAVVLKHAPTLPPSSIRPAELAIEAGVPAGPLNVVTGGTEVGQALVTDPITAMISLTGSIRAGRVVMAATASSVKRLHVELDGKAPHSPYPIRTFS